MSTKMGHALLPHASSDLQIRASHETLTVLLSARSSCFPHTRKTIARYLSLLRNIAMSPQCRSDVLLTKQIVRFTVAILDLFVLDEMQARRKERPGGKVYGRAGMLFDEDYRKCVFPYEMSDQPLSLLLRRSIRYHYAFCSEMSVYFETLAANASLRSVSTPDELERYLRKRKTDLFEIIYFDTLLSAEEINTTVCRIINHKRVLLVIPFCLDGHMGGFALAGNYLMKNDEKLFLPQSEPSHQDVLETLLRGGLPLIHLKSSGKHTPKEMPSGDANLSPTQAQHELKSIWREIAASPAINSDARKMTVRQASPYLFLAGEKRRLFMSGRMQRLERMYRQILTGNPGGRAAALFFTRTGLAATILGVCTAREFYRRPHSRPLLYVHPGFYYEADILVRRELAAVADFRHPDVRVFCVNMSSNPPFTTADTQYSYAKNRDELIRYVIARAAEFPRNHYFLIVDKTTDLFFQPFSEAKLPGNLHLFEIASLTKYRQGDHNHFSGVAVYRGNPALLPFIKTGLEKSHGSLSEREQFFIREMTASAVKKTVSLQHRQANVFIRSFNGNMLALPPPLRWRIERNPDSPQYVFLIPPMRAIAQASVARFPQPFFRKSGPADGLFKLYRCHKQFIKKIVHTAFRPFYSTPGYERGSSFGLDTTRATLIPGNFVYRGRLFSQKVPRISFGLQTSLASLDAFGNKLAAELILVTIKKITPLTVSTLRPDEQAAARLFVLHMLRQYGFAYNPDFHRDLDSIAGHYGNGTGIFYVLKNGKKICGTIAVALSGSLAQIKRFYVDPQFQGQGYGSQMIDEAMAFCRQHNCLAVEIKSEKVFRKAHILYKRKGFTVVSKDKKSYYFGKNIYG